MTIQPTSPCVKNGCELVRQFSPRSGWRADIKATVRTLAVKSLGQKDSVTGESEGDAKV